MLFSMICIYKNIKVIVHLCLERGIESNLVCGPDSTHSRGQQLRVFVTKWIIKLEFEKTKNKWIIKE